MSNITLQDGFTIDPESNTHLRSFLIFQNGRALKAFIVEDFDSADQAKAEAEKLMCQLRKEEEQMAKNSVIDFAAVEGDQERHENTQQREPMKIHTVRKYCQELERQGIEYVIIPVGQLKKHADPGASD